MTHFSRFVVCFKEVVGSEFYPISKHIGRYLKRTRFPKKYVPKVKYQPPKNLTGIVTRIFAIQPKTPKQSIRLLAQIRLKNNEVLALIQHDEEYLHERAEVLVRRKLIRVMPEVKYRLVNRSLQHRRLNK